MTYFAAEYAACVPHPSIVACAAILAVGWFVMQRLFAIFEP